MLISMPNMDYRATSKLRPGSLIEFQYFTDSLGVREARAFGLIIRMDWRPRHARSRCFVLTRADGLTTVDISHVCRILIY